MAFKLKMPKVPLWVGITAVGLGVLVYVLTMNGTPVGEGCPGSQVYCPGVGCVSGPDKCQPGASGGPSAVFSKETFAAWPGAGYTSTPPNYSKETFAMPRKMKTCPGGTRTDGPCLMDL